MAKKKPRGPHAKYWLKKADILWSKAIRTLFDGVCARCGKPGANAHHLIAKGKYSYFTRHTLMNGIYLCTNCHRFDNRIAAHGNAVVFSEWLKVAHPAHWNYVMRHKNEIKVPYDFEDAFHKLEDFLALSWLEMDEKLEKVRQLYQGDEDGR